MPPDGATTITQSPELMTKPGMRPRTTARHAKGKSATIAWTGEEEIGKP